MRNSHDAPLCAFCGGKSAATTKEHCPPRALFQYRHWPEGFEFPACDGCNGGTTDHDLLVAFIARLDPAEKGNCDGKAGGLTMQVNRQFPGLLAKMMPSAIEARRKNRQLGIRPKPGQTHQEAGPMKVPAEIDDAVRVFARKLAKGIYFQEVGAPFPDDGCLLLLWFTNEELFRRGSYLAFDSLKELAGVSPLLERNSKPLNDQFTFKLSLSQDKDVLVIQARFSESFAFVVFGSTKTGLLEDRITKLREDSKREGPIAVLQSKVLTK